MELNEAEAAQTIQKWRAANPHLSKFWSSQSPLLGVYNCRCVTPPIAVGGVPKPHIARTNGRWYVRSAPFTPGEDPTTFWDYWARLSVAIAWCERMNEDQAWEKWCLRAERGY